MSRPRKPFGREQPGRLPATMMKVLAAELTDPERLRRGKRLAKDGSVLDIVVEPGVVVSEVQGSRPTPYVATLEVSRGDGMPLRRDVNGHCTCPDADNLWGTAAGGSDICKHVVATMMTFADELLIEPELLDLWRGRDGATAPEPSVDEPSAAETGSPAGDNPPRSHTRPSEHPALTRRHLRVVGGTDHDDRAPERAPGADRLAPLLTLPAGATLPDIGRIEPIDAVLPPRGDLAAVIRDALANLRIDWD